MFIVLLSTGKTSNIDVGVARQEEIVATARIEILPLAKKILQANANVTTILIYTVSMIQIAQKCVLFALLSMWPEYLIITSTRGSFVLLAMLLS